MSRAVVLVTSRSFGSGDADPEARLRDAGIDVVRGDPEHDRELLADVLPRVTGWIAGTGPITDDHMQQAPDLKIIARYGVGVDAVDLDAARRRGIIVTNTPGANADAVADHTIGLMLAALRDVVAGDRAVRAGDWTARRGRELGSCTVGIVGYGTVGRAVHRRISGFGATVIAHDPYVSDAGVELVDLPDLAARADVITLHAPAGSTALVDEDLLAACRPGTILINTARAALVDAAAVTAALADGRLYAAASDVLDGDRTSPLLDAPHTTLTPHVAAQTVQAVDRMGMAVADECLRVLVHGDVPQNLVVGPEENG